jgi:hypothetical protein
MLYPLINVFENSKKAKPSTQKIPLETLFIGVELIFD